MEQLLAARKKPPAFVSEPVQPVPQEPTEEERRMARGSAAARLASRVALEARVGVPMSYNFAPDSSVVPDAQHRGLAAGYVAAGLRVGGFHRYDPSLGARFGIGADVKRVRVGDTEVGALDNIITYRTAQTQISVPLHLGLVWAVGADAAFGISWVPAFVTRDVYSGGRSSEWRFANFEVHAEHALTGKRGESRTWLKLFLEVQPQVGVKDRDDYVAYATAGVALAWY